MVEKLQDGLIKNRNSLLPQLFSFVRWSFLKYYAMSVCIYYSVLAYCFFSIDKTNAPTLSISTAIYPYYLTNIGLTISPKNTSYRLKPHCRPCKGLSTMIDSALHAMQAPSTSLIAVFYSI